MKALVIGLMALLAVSPCVAQVTWTEVDPAFTPFGSAGSEVLGNYYYCFGGSMTNPIAQAFNLTTENWAQSTPPPLGWNRFGAAATSDAVYLIGWCTVFPTMGNAVQRFTPTSGGPTGSWQQMSPYPITVLGMATAWDGGNYLYCAGGSDNVNVFPNSYRYDIAANSWSQLTSMPFGTVWSGGAFIGGKFYVVGGIYSPQLLLQYDPIANAWIQKAGPPNPVYYGISATYSDSLLFSIGGGGVSYPQSNLVQLYNPISNAWSQETPLPVVIGGNSAHFIAPDKVISAGGYMNGHYLALTYRGTGFPAQAVAPPAPQALVILIANGEAQLSWQPSAGATVYHVYGSSTPDGAGDLLATVNDTTWTDTDFTTRPPTFFYYVTAE